MIHSFLDFPLLLLWDLNAFPGQVSYEVPALCSQNIHHIAYLAYKEGLAYIRI